MTDDSESFVSRACVCNCSAGYTLSQTQTLRHQITLLHVTGSSSRLLLTLTIFIQLHRTVSTVFVVCNSYDNVSYRLNVDAACS
jgi:hypothetical protein